MQSIYTLVMKKLLYIAWVQALIATLGSLYFSEIVGFKPCTLCWYQRIFMYPLVIIFLVGLLRRERAAVAYALPLAIAGWLLAFYHNVISWYTPRPGTLVCGLGISCTERYINWFGFITIPLLSLTAFTVITFCLLRLRRLAST